MAIKLDPSYLKDFVSQAEVSYIEPQVKTCHKLLEDQNGPGNAFLGWVDLPSTTPPALISDVMATAQQIRESCDVLVVIGIGGSYLGARAAIEFLRGPFYNQRRAAGTPEILFAGNSLSPSALLDVLSLCEGKNVCINVISKSGTTTECAVAFRVLRDWMDAKYGAGAAKRIYCTTDKEKGTLKQLAEEQGYKTFVIPDDVGGRFSVLTPVGLLPIAVAGCDIQKLLDGAKYAQQAYSMPTVAGNPCYQYAALRNILLRKGKAIEVFVSYEPALAMMGEWFKQLYGESEGKDHKGLFPASMIFSTDLHSLGQFVQDGTRNLFETVVDIENSEQDLTIQQEQNDFDGLNFLAGKTLSQINRSAMQGTLLAHVEGGVPNIVISVEKRDEFCLGELIYFFEKACAISGYLLGVNPFDQPGVEDYKKNMFALLGKPGYEDRQKELAARLKENEQS